MKKITLMALIVMIAICANCSYAEKTEKVAPGQAAKKSDKEVTVVSTSLRAKEITGEITGISSNYISIVYSQDEDNATEYEALLLVGEGTTFTRKNLSALSVGDIVSVQCDDYIQTDSNGRKYCAKRVTKEVKFLSPARKDKLVGTEKVR